MGCPSEGIVPLGGCPARGSDAVAQGGFTFPIRIYWEDTDAGGVVFYANYLKFFERARTEWLRSLGIAQHSLREQTGGIFVVTSAQLEYLRPARLDDQLLVTAKLQSAGRASLTITQQALLLNTDDQSSEPTLLCAGSIRIGWVDGSTMRPARIPNRILEQLS
ncbi:MAG: tol-pal system-associated acyl-CoA thioesterase [Comamonas sp.]|nr:tol-pal system-associated acyl-CoA thioesterase [Comamonas sp.]